MSQAEWMLIVTIGSLVSVAAMGINLCVAVWHGLAPRPVPLTTWLGIMVLSASVLWTRWDEDDSGTIVAAVATAEPICSVSASPLHVDAGIGGGRLRGDWSGARGCHVWALIEDPRTEIVWLQGPAWFEDVTWTLDVSLARDEATADQDYLLSIAVVDDETHDAWLERTLALDGIMVLPAASATSWIARNVPL